MRLTGIVLLVVITAAWAQAQAQTYRWVDKDGKTRYGDVPPAGSKASALRPPAGPPPLGTAKDATAAGKGPLTPMQQEQAFRERQLKAREAEEKAGKERAAAEVQKQNCVTAQESVRMLESGRRISSVNEKGETVFLEDAQVQQRIADARKALAESCK